MIPLSQRDPRWANVKLKGTNLTLGKVGCTTTCISMLSRYFGIGASPVFLASSALDYTPDGLLKWESVNRLSHMRFDKRGYGRDDKEIQDALSDPDRAVILQVANGSHWIVAVRKSFLVNDYICYDPWDGKRCAAIAKYKNITGFATFKKS